jgi:PAS domain S-box-containing protein
MSNALSILIVEDRPEDAELLVHQLKRAGLPVDWVRVDNEQAYLEHLNNHVDLILADYTLPQFSALRALEQVQARNLDIPLIVVTGTVSEEVAVECMKRGAADYLIKDRLARLGQAISHALEQRYLREQKRHADEALRLYTTELERMVEERTRELRRAKEHVEAILNNTSDAIIMMRRDMSIRQTNPAFNTLFGYDTDELFGRSVRILVHPDQQAFLDAALQSVQIDDTSGRIELAMQRKDGTLFDADVALDSATDEPGSTGLMCSVRDNTLRKQMERALKESEARYRRLAENAQDTIYRIELYPAPRLEYISPAVTSLVGYTPDELYRQPQLLLGLLYPDDRSLVQDILDNHTRLNDSVVLRWRQMDNTFLWAEHRNVPIYDDTGTLVAVEGIARDITQRQRVEAELRNALEQEKELNELKTRFASMVSHEFRTPLAIIQSAADLVKHYGTRMTAERQHEQLDEVHTQVKHLVSLLDDILDISRAESKSLQLSATPIDFTAFCETVVREVERTDRTHEIRFEFSGNIREAVVDRNLMHRAVSNLLTNAVKYSPEGSTVFIELRSSEGILLLSVRDQGIGIPEEDRERLFEPFHRARNVGLISGTGLGLAIVKQAVEAHGGRIEYESRVGEGTTFTLRIPRIPGH